MEITNRFSGAVWAKEIKNYNAVLAGAGATGSWLGLFLARAGIREIQIVDPDIYEMHNIGSQFASYDQIGINKAYCLAENLNRFTNLPKVDYFNTKIQDFSIFPSYNSLYCATLDNMEGRKYLFEKFKTQAVSNCLFLDSRISAEYWEVYCVVSGDASAMQRYEETLFSEDQGYTGDCNYQQSSHSACGAALKMVELLTNYITNVILEDNYLPFKISNNIRTCNYEITY